MNQTIANGAVQMFTTQIRASAGSQAQMSNIPDVNTHYVTHTHTHTRYVKSQASTRSVYWDYSM